jgi:transcriptional regulator with XRE-family HTH domain
LTVVENENQLLVNLGMNIRKLRLQSELSQAQLAFEANLTREFINGLEGGKLNVSILNLQQIAIALNVPVHQLLIFGE